MVATKKYRSVKNQWLSRATVNWLLFVIFILLAITTVCLLFSDKEQPRSSYVIKTVAGDNLEPTPWHPFQTKSFADGRASYIMKCANLNRTSPPRFNRLSTSLFQNSTGSCPAFFQWIHEDLRPWRSSGITETNIMEAKEFAAFRVLIVGGRLYVDLYYACVQSRMMFTIWGLLQLLEMYPGMVPDVDLMFDCMDKPKIERLKYQRRKSPPPPLFRYCSNRDHFDMPFPDWSFWGWTEVNLAPWEEEFKSIKQGSKAVKWIQRKPIAYWKGNPDVMSPIRTKLLECNSPSTWGAEILRQNWIEEANAGYEQSKLSNQCRNRYKIYTEGFAWSVSFKYILSCDSPVLVATPEYYDFFTRGLMPQENYWPVRSTKLCQSIKFAVDWGNNHLAEAEAIGKGGQNFMQELNMDNVYGYMFHLLSEYSKLQTFRPQVPTTAQEVYPESVLCLAEPKEKAFLERTLRKTTTYPQPCSLNPPNNNLIKQWMEKKTKILNNIEKMEDMAQTRKIEDKPQGKKLEVTGKDKKLEDKPQGKKLEDTGQGKKLEATPQDKEDTPQGKKMADRNQRTQKKMSKDVPQRKKKNVSHTKKTEDVTQDKKLEDMPRGKRMPEKRNDRSQ